MDGNAINKKKRPMKTSIIVTTINKPNFAIDSLSNFLSEDVSFYIAGDNKTPDEAYLEFNGQYLSLGEQKSLFARFTALLPENHYCRKNVAYLKAITEGCERIVETDDDNIPKADFLSRTYREINEYSLAKNNGWHNPYRHFTDIEIWPRGLPLDFVRSCTKYDEVEYNIHDQPIKSSIQQGLADANPDVDAVFRLLNNLPVYFNHAQDLVLQKGTWSPFNSQNTTWFKEAFMFLYLPAHCSFRMTDIWRSYVAQRILWEQDEVVTFYSPTVYQERNEHDIMKDFMDEVPGNQFNSIIFKELESLELKRGIQYAGDNLYACYELLVALGAVGSQELPLLREWIRCVDDA